MSSSTHKRALCNSSSIEWLCDVRPAKAARPSSLSPAVPNPQLGSPRAPRSSSSVKTKGRGRELRGSSVVDENASPARSTSLAAARQPSSSSTRPGQQALGFKVGKSTPLSELKNTGGRTPRQAVIGLEAPGPSKGYEPPPSPTPIVRSRLTTKEKAQQRAQEQKKRELEARAVKERAKTGGGLRGWLSAGSAGGPSKSK